MDTFDLYSLMERDHVLLAFKGSITSDLLTSVLQIMESKMDDLNDAPKTKRRVFNVLVECLQNLYHHIDDFQIEGEPMEVALKKSAIFSISRTEESYNIITGNFIHKSNVSSVTEKIDFINSLNKDELKQHYKKMLSNGEMSDKGGGGLGIIDIARKSKQKLVYDFMDVDDTYSFFSLYIKIPQK